MSEPRVLTVYQEGPNAVVVHDSEYESEQEVSCEIELIPGNAGLIKRLVIDAVGLPYPDSTSWSEGCMFLQYGE